MDVTADANIMLDALTLFNGVSGVNKPIALIRGSKVKSINSYHNHNLMGSGKHRSELYWKIFTDCLTKNELLRRKHLKIGDFHFLAIEMTQIGKNWLKAGKKPLKLVLSEQLLELLNSEKNVSTGKPLSTANQLSKKADRKCPSMIANIGKEFPRCNQKR